MDIVVWVVQESNAKPSHWSNIHHFKYRNSLQAVFLLYSKYGNPLIYIESHIRHIKNNIIKIKNMNGIISDLLGYLMQLKQLSSWGSFNSIKDKVHNEIITSWLLEKGPITKRIKKTGSFQLNLIQDKLSKISIDDKKFINTESEKIKKREVILLCNDLPIVFALSLIHI